jgi:hypothetical protein
VKCVRSSCPVYAKPQPPSLSSWLDNQPPDSSSPSNLALQTVVLLPAQHTFSTLIVLLLAAGDAVVLSLILNSINNAHLELRISRKQYDVARLPSRHPSQQRPSSPDRGTLWRPNRRSMASTPCILRASILI